MQITIYNNFSKRQNSTLQPSGGVVKNVVMKRECSILNPVFQIDGVDPAANYCQWNNRYYFINDIVLQNNNIYEIHCEIDVLATWKSQIGASSQYVLRSASEYDGDIVDGFYITKKDPIVNVIDSSPMISWAQTVDSGWYIVGVIGGTDSANGIHQGTVQYYCMSPASFSAFAQAVFTESNWTDLQSADRYYFNPIQYIASVMWFPVQPPVFSQPRQSIKLGWQTIPCVALVITDPVSRYTYTFSYDDHPQAATRGDYLNAAPFSEYCIKFPPFADVELDGDLLMKKIVKSITCEHLIDFISGKSALRVFMAIPGVQKRYEIAIREVQFGVTIQLSQIAADRLGVLETGIGTAAGLIGSISTGNVLGAITGTVSGIISAYQTAQPRVASHGSNDSMVAVTQYPYPGLQEIFHEVVDEDNADYGRPLCQTRVINTLSGYILCSHAEIAIPGLPAERDQIISFMESGFFYE